MKKQIEVKPKYKATTAKRLQTYLGTPFREKLETTTKGTLSSQTTRQIRASIYYNVFKCHDF